MFPLKVRKIGGYKFGEPTFYNNFHLGVDYSANYVELYAPFNGEIISEVTGTQGGKTIWFKPDNQDVIIRFMHLSEYKANGRVKEGDLIAITGNTGNATTAPHLHLDISKGQVIISDTNNFIDPEQFNWGGVIMGFDENHVLSIFKNLFDKAHELIKGVKFDTKNDANYALELTKKGSTTAAKEQIERYFKEQTYWVKADTHIKVQQEYEKDIAKQRQAYEKHIQTLKDGHYKELSDIKDVYGKQLAAAVLEIDDLKTKLAEKPAVIVNNDEVQGVGTALAILIKAIKYYWFK